VVLVHRKHLQSKREDSIDDASGTSSCEAFASKLGRVGAVRVARGSRPCSRYQNGNTACRESDDGGDSEPSFDAKEANQQQRNRSFGCPADETRGNGAAYCDLLVVSNMFSSIVVAVESGFTL
jgi:hypothetical protein